ncbi:MAG: alpha/beta fold hydrolase, partial [Geminicoccaceae bacterium]
PVLRAPRPGRARPAGVNVGSGASQGKPRAGIVIERACAVVKIKVGRREMSALHLRDGRRLGYATYGAADGVPVLAFHGTPGSRFMLRAADAPAGRLGIRLIAPDRPGFGLSDPKPGRRIGDWPDDVVELADALGLWRFVVVGISGGGPYATACAWKIPQRIEMAGIISGVGPLDPPEVFRALDRRRRMILATCRRAPRVLRIALAAAALGWRHAPERMFRSLAALGPRSDRVIARSPEVASSLKHGIVEGFRQGGRGVAEELVLFARPWGFALHQVSVPVRLWHGTADRVVPPAIARYQAAAIPGCRAEFIAGAGHFYGFNHIERLLAELARPHEPGPSATLRQGGAPG